MNYSLFEDIDHKPLRVYNRSVMFYNIYEDAGKAAAEEYLKELTPEDKVDMVAMIQLVKKHGPKLVKEWVTKGLVFPENMTEEERIERLGTDAGA